MNSAPGCLAGSPRGGCGATRGRECRAAGAGFAECWVECPGPPPPSPLARTVGRSGVQGPAGRSQSARCTCTEIVGRMRGPRKAGPGREGSCGPPHPQCGPGISSVGARGCCTAPGDADVRPRCDCIPAPPARAATGAGSQGRGARKPGRPLPRALAGRRVQTMGREMEMLS